MATGGDGVYHGRMVSHPACDSGLPSSCPLPAADLARRGRSWFARRWARRRLWRTAGAVLVCLFVALNVVALHARAMTHFVDEGRRTPRPEALSAWQKAWIMLAGVRIPRPRNCATPASLGLPFEAYRLPTAGGELEAWYIRCPHPRGLVVLLHGYAGCKADLLAEAEVFHQQQLAALLLDFRGSGGSSGRDTTVGVREADDVAAACAYAGATWRDLPLVLYGQSMGSAAAMRAVARGMVNPRAMILESPFDRLCTTVGNRFRSMGLPAWPGAPLLVFWGGLQCGFNGFAHNPSEYARHVRAPVLLLHGGRDLRVTRAAMTAIYEALAGPRRLVIFPEAGHESFLAADPPRWKESVAQFLGEHLASTYRARTPPPEAQADLPAPSGESPVPR